jgi:CBS domain-containing protein
MDQQPSAKRFRIEAATAQIAEPPHPVTSSGPSSSSSSLSVEQHKRTHAETEGGELTRISKSAVWEDGDDLLLLLAKTKVETLLAKEKRKGLVTVHRTDTLPVAFKKLVDEEILSAPVLNKNHKFYGFVDMLDLVAYVVREFGRESVTFEDIEEMFEREDKFKVAKVHEIMLYPVSKANPFHPIQKGYSLFHAFEILAWSGLHRVPVVDGSMHVVDVITQSMLVRYLYENMPALGSRRYMRVADMKFPPGVVVYTTNNVKAITAFNTMVEKGVSGLPVVDEKTGWLVDNISIRDLRGIRDDAKLFWRLWDPVGVFKTKVRQEFQHIPNHVVYVLPTDTLETVITRMVENRIHRIFVIDSEQTRRPIRVISQSDVLKAFLRT